MAFLNKEAFLQSYNIDQAAFEQLDISWNELMIIYEDYSVFSDTLKPIANTIAELLRSHPDIHTVKSRIKKPEHLIEKIIRKSINKKDTEYKITIDNYKEMITDLIGIRVLHLYKDQATNIDTFIRKTWALKEKATIYYRKGDNVYSDAPRHRENFNLEEHPAGYRSWHYLIQTNLMKTGNIIEVQVRTIFEEGWSEVDHELRYHYDLSNPLLVDQLLVLNRIAGSADEMVNTIRETKRGLDHLMKQNKEYKEKIEELSNDLKHALQDNTSNVQLVSDLQAKIDILKATINHLPIPYGRMNNTEYQLEKPDESNGSMEDMKKDVNR